VNIKTSLERLRERFLRTDSQGANDDACVQGGSILKKAISDGITFGRPELCDLLQADYFGDEHDRTFHESKLRFAFQFFCLTSDDPNVLGLRKIRPTSNGVSCLTTDADNYKRQGERLAEFCLELAVLVDSVPEDANSTKYLEAIKLWNNNPELSWADIAEQVDKNRKGSPAFSKAVERFAKSRSIEMKKRKPGMRRKSN